MKNQRASRIERVSSDLNAKIFLTYRAMDMINRFCLVIRDNAEAEFLRRSLLLNFFSSFVFLFSNSIKASKQI